MPIFYDNPFFIHDILLNIIQKTFCFFLVFPQSIDIIQFSNILLSYIPFIFTIIRYESFLPAFFI